MPRKANPLQEVKFPVKGLHESLAFSRQLDLTCAQANNVVGYDPTTGRLRGARRSGLGLYVATQFNSGSTSIQDINSVTIVAAASTSMQQQRNIFTMLVTGGKLYRTSSGTAVDASFLSSTAARVFSAAQQGVLFYTDGTSTYKKYTASTNTAATWTASSGGSLPTNGGAGCKLIESWRGRIVLAGLPGEEHNWFMSEVDDPLDFDYQDDANEMDAVAGNNAPDGVGRVGDVINTIIPWSDDLLLWGCDRSIWMMDGDPMAGGRNVRISASQGMAWGRPWCIDPAGTIWFVGSRGGFYRMSVGGSVPEIVSQPIHERMTDINLATHYALCAYDTDQQCIHVFFTTHGSATADSHFIYDVRSEAWWPMSFANNNQNPKCVHVVDGDAPDDRRVLLGSWDGYVHTLDKDADDDDGTDIASSVTIGPIAGANLESFKIEELQPVLDDDSDQVTWTLYRGISAQQAFESAAAMTGNWEGGRNYSEFISRSGSAFYLKLSQSTGWWAYEKLMAYVAPMGRARQRSLLG